MEGMRRLEEIAAAATAAAAAVVVVIAAAADFLPPGLPGMEKRSWEWRADFATTYHCEGFGLDGVALCSCPLFSFFTR